jgi:parallel beta-helix repeat protein
MTKNHFSIFVLALLLFGTVASVNYVQKAEAAPSAIYIRSDGSIDPPTTLVRGDGTRYNFTGDISGEIVVQRSNILIDGKDYTLQGSGTGSGFSMTGLSNVTIWRTIIMNFSSGIFLDNSRDNRITTNIIQNNSVGVNLYGMLSTNNTFILNLMFGNDVGVEINMGSASNMFHCNTFLENEIQARVWLNASNFWDDSPYGGNYWSNYTGVDIYPYVGGDGIGDTPHIIDANNVDQKPFMGMVTGTCFEFLVGTEWVIMGISVVSDSPYVAGPVLHPGTPGYDISAIRFNVTGPDGTTGFSRIALPHALLEPPYTITFDYSPKAYTTIFENDTLSILYFNYTHSTHEIVIVPEFSSFIIPLLFMTVPLIAIVLRRKRRPIA